MKRKFGIDISSWQRNYPYKTATKEGVEFAILRAGFSVTKDNMFNTHYKNAKRQGWGVGAYWYTYAKSVSEARKEAKAFLKVIKGKKFEYPIYLDIEDASLGGLGKTTLNNIVKEFAEVIEKAGYYFGVYTNYDWYKNKISGSTLNKKYDWWIASWTKTKPTSVKAGLWQFGGSSNEIRNPRIGGVTTDQDFAYKDYPEEMKEKGLNGFKKSDPKKEKYTTGEYVTLMDMNVRTGAGVSYRQKLVKELTVSGKKNATNKNPNAKAVYKKGTHFTAIKIIKNGKTYWAKTPSGYVCIKGIIKRYCKKI